MNKNSKWIGIPDGVICDTPKFCRNITFDGNIKNAILSVTAVGIYECKIDGHKIGADVLSPGWTRYDDHIQYNSYDISDILKNGSRLEILCGNGWARGKMGWNEDENFYAPAILCRYSIEMEFENGKTAEFISDENTEIMTSDTLFADIYNGEIIDRTAPQALIGKAKAYDFKTKLLPRFGEAVTEQEHIHPVRSIITPKGERVIDFGQNITGYVEVTINGKKGDKISFRHAEILDSDGNFYTANLRGAKNEITYICGGGKETFKPSLSFQGFRYICLDEYPLEIDLNCFTAIEVHSDMKRTGSFVCGFDKLNKLYSNIIWGQKDNFLDIPTDCPQRDERLGWTGDAQVFAQTAAINFDVEKFFEKWLYDLRCEQFDDGAVPPIVPNCFPRKDLCISAAWADAAVICPWEMYRAYGNKKILRDNFECMRRWVDYMHKQGEEEFLWLGGKHFGDWLALDVEGSMEGATDTDFIASCFFAYSTSLLIKAGKILCENIEKYENMYLSIKEAIINRFTKDGLPISRTQTACALLIYFDLCDNPETVGKFLIDIIAEHNGHLTTGFVGTPYMLHALSMTGHTDTAYELLLKEDYPSWLYSVNHGATTIWEHWDGIKEDGSLWDTSMNSYNHYAYGSVYSWMFKYIGGIDIPGGGEGYKKVIIAPKPEKRLQFAEVSINTRSGKITSAWRYYDSFVRYEIEIPNGVSAHISLTNGNEYDVIGGKHIFYTET